MMTDKYFSFPFHKSCVWGDNGCAQGVKTLRNTFEENPKTGLNGGMGRLYVQPEHSNGGANENNVKNDEQKISTSQEWLCIPA